ncbi:MAG: glycosyltransferase [Peptococcaceae bacterium]|nr:glycosyltransferase [Peptococcaceae bacterium]
MRKLAIIVPAYNEEKVIGKCLNNLTGIFRREDIYVVSDGSTDRTAEIALDYTKNVLSLPVNHGKIGAIKRLLETYQLLENYGYIAFHDADSRIMVDREYFEKLLPLPGDVACLCAQVRSHEAQRFIDAYRAYEYFVSHYIYKNSQSLMRCILVAPGCLAVYKADVLKKLSLDGDTLTEDMDLTIQIYRRKLGRILYDAKLLVDSHNPQNLKNFYMQVRRWYIGFWQNVRKHSMMKKLSPIDLEVGIFLLESVVTGLLLLLIPSAILLYPKPTCVLILINWLVVIGVSTVAGIYLRRWRIILWSPLFVYMHLINLITFLSAFLGFFVLSPRTMKEAWYFQER